MAYLSTSDINTYLGTSGEDTLIGVINSNAEAILNSMIGTDGLATATYTEKIEYPAFTNDNYNFAGHIFYLNQVNPTVLTSIDGVAISSGDYEITGQKVFLKNAMTLQSSFPYKNTIVYTAGFATIPNDIKQAMYLLVGALYNTKTAGGIASFRQDLLSVNYDKDSLNNLLDPNSNSLLTGIVNKYKVPLVLSTGPNRTQG